MSALKIILLIMAILLFNTALKAENNDSFRMDVIEKQIITDTPPFPIKHLQLLNLQQYIGQPIDSLLVHLNIPYTTPGVGSCRFRYACYMPVFFPNALPFLKIWVGNLIYQPKYSENANWDLTLFKKEIIREIQLFDENSFEVLPPIE